MNRTHLLQLTRRFDPAKVSRQLGLDLLIAGAFVWVGASLPPPLPPSSFPLPPIGIPSQFAVGFSDDNYCGKPDGLIAMMALFNPVAGGGGGGGRV